MHEILKTTFVTHVVCPVIAVQLPAGSLHPRQGAHASPGAAAGGIPGLLGAAGHADRLGSRLHRRPVRHAAGRPAGAQRDPQTIRKRWQYHKQFQFSAYQMFWHLNHC